MQSTLARDGQYALIVGALYGVFSGVFIGRATRLCASLTVRRPRTAPPSSAEPKETSHERKH